MKKTISIVIVSVMLFCAFATSCAAPAAGAPAQAAQPQTTQQQDAQPQAAQPQAAQPQATAAPVAEPQPVVQGDIQANVEAMMPIMDSVVRAMREGDGEDYEPRDDDFFWSLLYLMGVNWGHTHPVAEIDGPNIVLRTQIMQEFASAAFYDYSDLLPLDADDWTNVMTYDAGRDAYVIELSDVGESETKLESYTANADGSVTAVVGLYGGEEKTFEVTLTLVANPYASGITNAFYLYSVADAKANVVQVDEVFKKLDSGAPISIDFDGSGKPVTVKMDIDTSDDDVEIEFKTGTVELEDEYEYFFNASCYVADIDVSDGMKEFILTGDTGSDDYITIVYRVIGNKLQKTEIPFGSVVNATGDGLVSVEGNIDVLGTYGASCLYMLNSGKLSFELASDYSVIRDDDFKEYRTITVAKSGLPAFDGGDFTNKIKLDKGTKLCLVSSDAKSFAILEREDGSMIKLDIAHPSGEQWGWEIDGRSENEWFEFLPYAG